MDNLIRNMWKFECLLWEYRNRSLHAGEFAIFEQEERAFCKAVRRDWRLGPNGVRTSDLTLISNNKEITINIQHFAVVQGAREYEGLASIEDEFSDVTNGL